MWYDERTLIGKLFSAFNILVSILLSPFLLGWALLARRDDWHLLSLACCYMFSPLAMVWLGVTHRELCIQAGSFSWVVRPNVASSRFHFTNYIEKVPRHHLGPLEVFFTRHIVTYNRRTSTYGRLTIRWSSRCPYTDLLGFRQRHLVPVGPVQITGWHCT